MPDDNYVNGDGDLVFNTPLRGIDVYSNNLTLPENASYDEFKYGWLQKLRKDAADQFQYSLAGVAPLHYFTEDSPNSVSDNPFEPYFFNRITAQNQIRDSIQKRDSSGFYKIHPNQRAHDERIYHQYDNPCYGWSCIFTNTNSYGYRFGNRSNTNFVINHPGFELISIYDSLLRGDILLARRPWEIGAEAYRPYHAVMMNNYNPSRDSVNVYDNHGYIIPYSIDNKTYVLDKYNSDADTEGHPSIFMGFRFYGDQQTESDIIKEFREYRKRKRQEESEN